MQHDANTKFTFIFSLSPCIIPGNDMHTSRVQAKGNQLNFDTSCQAMHISNKQNSKALSLVVVIFPSYQSHLRELEMKGFTQIEGQSAQGSDKQCFMYISLTCK